MQVLQQQAAQRLQDHTETQTSPPRQPTWAQTETQTSPKAPVLRESQTSPLQRPQMAESQTSPMRLEQASLSPLQAAVEEKLWPKRRSAEQSPSLLQESQQSGSNDVESGVQREGHRGTVSSPPRQRQQQQRQEQQQQPLSHGGQIVRGESQRPRPQPILSKQEPTSPTAPSDATQPSGSGDERGPSPHKDVGSHGTQGTHKQHPPAPPDCGFGVGGDVEQPSSVDASLGARQQSPPPQQQAALGSQSAQAPTATYWDLLKAEADQPTDQPGPPGTSGTLTPSQLAYTQLERMCYEEALKADCEEDPGDLEALTRRLTNLEQQVARGIPTHTGELAEGCARGLRDTAPLQGRDPAAFVSMAPAERAEALENELRLATATHQRIEDDMKATEGIMAAYAEKVTKEARAQQEHLALADQRNAELQAANLLPP